MKTRPSRIVSGIAALSLGLLAGCQLAIEHGLDEHDANELVGALERAGIGAEKSADEGAQPPSFTIAVSQSDAGRALELMRVQGLPHGRHAGFGEVYGKTSLIPTHTEEQARYLQALTGELEKTLENIDGVVDARVHVVLQEHDSLTTGEKPQVPASAAVLLKVRAGFASTANADVQKLIAASVAGLSADRVSVVLTAAPEIAVGNELVSVGPLRVAPASRPTLLAAFAIGIAALGLMAILLLLAARRLSSTGRQPSSPE